MTIKKNVSNPPPAQSGSSHELHEREIADDIDGTKYEPLNLPITEDEIRAAIRALKNQKAAGPDGLIEEFIRTVLGRFCTFWWIFSIICLIMGCFRMNGLYRLYILCTKRRSRHTIQL